MRLGVSAAERIWPVCTSPVLDRTAEKHFIRNKMKRALSIVVYFGRPGDTSTKGRTLMSKSEMSRFVAAVSADAALQALARAKGTDVPAVIELAKSKGYDIGAEDIDEHIRKSRAELTEDQLGSVAGGLRPDPTMPGIPRVVVILF
jgi:predicted ribosomally synthesized peptide with nif11-like leader